MSDIAEGIGGVIEGALAGRAVEPKDSEHGDTASAAEAQYPPEECANCGAIVTSTYCPQCGQKRHVHRTLAAIGHDLLHGVLHLDGKFWKTLPLLIFKPGKLTRRYIEGERAKFVSPMAMFLFSVFAMFAVFQMLGLSVPSNIDGADAVGRSAATLRSTFEDDRERLTQQIAALEDGNETNSERRAALENELADTESAIERIDNLDPEKLNGGSLLEFDNNVDVNLTGIEALDKGLVKKWRENPGLMLYKLQANGYKFSWLLIPLSIPFVWLVFAWRRRFKAYDHAIFVTYSLSFMSLLFIAISGLGIAGAPVPLIVFSTMLLPPLHLYKQLRYTYEIGRFSAIWRLLFLSIFIWIVIALFLQALLLLGAF